MLLQDHQRELLGHRDHAPDLPGPAFIQHLVLLTHLEASVTRHTRMRTHTLSKKKKEGGSEISGWTG